MTNNNNMSLNIRSLIATVCLLFSIEFIQAQVKPIQIFVSNTGNDSNPGSINLPIKSLSGLANKIKQFSGNGAITVYFRAGTYAVSSTFAVSMSSASNNEITISNYNNEKVEIIGGKILDNHKIRIATQKDANNQLSTTSVGKIYVTDLQDQSVLDVGIMKRNGFGSMRQASAIELFEDDTPLSLSRWPKDSLLEISSIISKGDPKISSDRRLPQFTYKTTKPKEWDQKSNIWVAGQFSVGWAYDNLPVSSLDATNQSITLNSNSSYGLYATNDTSSNPLATSKKVRGFYFYNVLKELDKPGEWYIDSINKRLFIWPLSDISKSVLEVSTLETPMFSISNCHNIKFIGLQIHCTRGIIFDINSSSNIAIQNCTLSNCGLQAIKVTQGLKIAILNCLISNTGAEGIVMTGGDRRQLTSSNNLISNTEIYNFSRLYRSYAPGISLDGVGNKIENCYIHDAPDQAIIFQGNNHLIHNNHIQNVCSGFSDMGAVYTGRDPSSTGTIIQNNFFDNVLNKNSTLVAAIYIDDGSGGIVAKNNIFVHCGNITGFGAIQVNGGSDNHFDNNIFAYSSRAFSNSPWSDERWVNMYLKDSTYIKKLTQTVDITSSIYTTQYPWLIGFFNLNTIKKRVNYVNNTICYNVIKFSSGGSYVVKDSIMTSTNPGFSYPEQNNFTLTKTPEATNRWTGWTPVDFSAIGRK